MDGKKQEDMQEEGHREHSLDEKIRECEIWIKGMNYKLFLEYTHSQEYYELIVKRKKVNL